MIGSIPKTSLPSGRSNQLDKIGICFPLLLFYVYLEHGRPMTLLSSRLPMIISLILFMGWVLSPRRKWNGQIVWFIIFLLIMAFGVTFAENTYYAFWATYVMLVTMLFFCIPVIQFVDSFRKMRILIDTIIVVFAYVGVYAILNQGFGPGGSASAQDENYVATVMAMGFPLAFFSVFGERNKCKKALYVGTLAVYVVATVVSLSRGGFIAVAVVLLYCVLKTPKKWVGGLMGILVVIAVVSTATGEYWKEMETILDVGEGTAQHRIELWKVAVREFLDHPIMGVGPGNFRWNIEWYQSEEQMELFNRSLAGSYVTHSMFFELLAEMGILGVMVFLKILHNAHKDMGIIRRVTARSFAYEGGVGGPNSEESTTNAIFEDLIRARYYSHAIVGATIGCLTGGIFLSLLYFPHFWTLAAIAVALKEVTMERVSPRHEK